MFAVYSCCQPFRLRQAVPPNITSFRYEMDIMKDRQNLSAGYRDTEHLHLATPVCESCDPLLNTMDSLDLCASEFLSHFHANRLIAAVLLGGSLRKKSSNDMAFPHPQSRKEQYRKKDIPDTEGVVVSIRRRIINVPEYRNATDDVNPAKNRPCGTLAHNHLAS